MDLIDVKKIINDDSRRAVELMQNFHQVVYGQINNSMPKHQHEVYPFVETKNCVI